MEDYERLEQQFGQWAQVRNVVACSSGSAALHLALEALRLPRGCQVLVPTLSMIACARAVTLAGLEPVFVDCGADLNLDPELLSRCGYPSVILAVHTYGRQCDMEAIHQFAEYIGGCDVVEDLAEAHGLTPHPKTTAACWSFYRNKIIAGEEGGAVAFSSERHAELARSLRCQGFTAAHDFTHVPRGMNYRLSNANARLVLNSLERIGKNWQRRLELMQCYDRLCPEPWHMPARLCPWVYDIRVPGLTSEQQDRCIVALQAAGVQARHCFKPAHLQEEYKRNKFVAADDWRNQGESRDVLGDRSSVAAREVLYLPLTPDGSVTEATCQRINVLWTCSSGS